MKSLKFVSKAICFVLVFFTSYYSIGRTFERPIKPKLIRSHNLLPNTDLVFNEKKLVISCTYQVHNPAPCSVDVTVEFYSSNSICSTTSTTIPPNSSQSFNCGSCSQPLSDVQVILNKIGSTNVGAFVNVGTTQAQGSYSNPCPPTSGGNYTMNWFEYETIIGY
jgi:hypothetical protein